MSGVSGWVTGVQTEGLMSSSPLCLVDHILSGVQGEEFAFCSSPPPALPAGAPAGCLGLAGGGGRRWLPKRLGVAQRCIMRGIPTEPHSLSLQRVEPASPRCCSSFALPQALAGPRSLTCPCGSLWAHVTVSTVPFRVVSTLAVLPGVGLKHP